ncbi:MAG: hypothetical protein IMX04_03080 [Candidatus Carbobacillus altaicus]|nr:hypothetical protein [Candidatus Carbobacillus altaicus]
MEQKLAGETAPLSQLGKAMADLEIMHIKAMSPQMNWDHIFTILEHRQVGPGQTVAYGRKIYTFAKKRPGPSRSKPSP